MVDNINKLSIEILVVIFKKLSLYDVIACMQTCQRWQSIIVSSILPKQLCTFANLNPALKKDLIKDGWSEICEDYELMSYLWTKYSARLMKGTNYLEIKLDNRYR